MAVHGHLYSIDHGPRLDDCVLSIRPLWRCNSCHVRSAEVFRAVGERGVKTDTDDLRFSSTVPDNYKRVLRCPRHVQASRLCARHIVCIQLSQAGILRTSQPMHQLVGTVSQKCSDAHGKVRKYLGARRRTSCFWPRESRLRRRCNKKCSSVSQILYSLFLCTLDDMHFCLP